MSGEDEELKDRQVVASEVHETFVLEVSSRLGLGLVDGDDWGGARLASAEDERRQAHWSWCAR